jgi:hypothetical protein
VVAVCACVYACTCGPPRISCPISLMFACLLFGFLGFGARLGLGLVRVRLGVSARLVRVGLVRVRLGFGCVRLGLVRCMRVCWQQHTQQHNSNSNNNARRQQQQQQPNTRTRTPQQRKPITTTTTTNNNNNNNKKHASPGCVCVRARARTHTLVDGVA